MKIMFNVKKFFLDLKYNTPTKKQLQLYKISFLDLQKEYNIITDMQYEIEVARVMNADKKENDIKIIELGIMKKYNQINDVEYHKQVNDLKNKPWVAIKTKYDDNINPDNLEIEVVYNRTFIDKMRSRGLPGDTDEEIVEQWLRLFFAANLEEDDLTYMNGNENNFTSVVDLSDNKKIII